MWRINGSKQIVKVILCCGRYRDGNRPGRHGNAAGSFGVSNSQTYGRVRTKAPRLRYSVERRVNSCRFRLVAEGGRRVRGKPAKKGRLRSEGEREGKRGCEIHVGGKGRAPESRSKWKEWRTWGAEEKKGERAATPHVCFSTSRHGDPLAFVTVMGWENTAAGRRSSLPRLSGTPALTIILLKEGETSLSDEILPILLYRQQLIFSTRNLASLQCV